MKQAMNDINTILNGMYPKKEVYTRLVGCITVAANCRYFLFGYGTVKQNK